LPRIVAIRLRAPDPKAQMEFYCDVLGMREREDGTIGYADEEAGLLFEAGGGLYEMTTGDLYWKVSISVPNIDLACQQLAGKNVEIETPRQVGDIAFLSHFKDPAGFVIELIDHWFEGERPSHDFDGRRLGGGAHLSLLTLRSNDIAQVESACEAMGMTPLSIVPAPDRGFTLYFYGSASTQPPSPNLYAVENRTWVYQRPYTVLEVLHRPEANPMSRPLDGNAGYGGSKVSGLEHPFQDDHLWISSA